MSKKQTTSTHNQKVDLDLVERRSLVGVLSLISRSFLIQVISFASTFLLTIFLDPKVFGIFFLVSAFVNFFSYFSDMGLAAALIQKKETVTEEDLKTTFAVQQMLVLILLIVIIGFSPLVQRWYGLSQASVYLVYALGISFFLSSMKTIPSVLLERNLKFNLVVIPQILETLVFNILAVTLAWKGFGLTSFTIAVLARGVVGLLAMYIISPWPIGLAFSKSSLLGLLKFGLPYQANTIVAVLKDDLMTVFLGKVIGPIGLGYLGWAKKWAELPLRFLMDNVSKVAFPAFARMQEESENLKKAVEKSLFFLSFTTFPILVGFAVLASDLVKIIPRYSKWEPALLALYLYCFNSGWALISTSMTNLLNAIGLIKKTFKLMIMWLVLTWIFMPVLGYKYGYNGVAAATALIAISSAAAVYMARQKVKFDLFTPIGKPLLASLLMGVVIFLFKPTFRYVWLSLLFRLVLGGVSYCLFSFLFIGSALSVDIKRIIYEFRKKK